MTLPAAITSNHTNSAVANPSEIVVGHHHFHAKTDDKEPLDPELASMVQSAGTYYSQDAAAKAKEIESIRKGAGLNPEDRSLYELFDEWRMKFHPKARMNQFLQSISASTPELAKRTICPTEYYRYLLNLDLIHESLEIVQKTLLASRHPLSVFVKTELFRSAKIKDDIGVWVHLRDEKKPITVDYKLPTYILKAGRSDPELTIIMMYVIYGTVMSGGQTNKNKVALDVKRGKDCFDNIPKDSSGVGLFEIKQGDTVLDDAGIAQFKLDWHTRLSEAGKLIPIASHQKLKDEMGKIFAMMLEMLEVHVQGCHKHPTST